MEESAALAVDRRVMSPSWPDREPPLRFSSLALWILGFLILCFTPIFICPDFLDLDLCECVKCRFCRGWFVAKIAFDSLLDKLALRSGFCLP